MINFSWRTFYLNLNTYFEIIWMNILPILSIKGNIQLSFSSKMKFRTTQFSKEQNGKKFQTITTFKIEPRQTHLINLRTTCRNQIYPSHSAKNMHLNFQSLLHQRTLISGAYKHPKDINFRLLLNSINRDQHFVRWKQLE